MTQKNILIVFSIIIAVFAVTTVRVVWAETLQPIFADSILINDGSPDYSDTGSGGVVTPPGGNYIDEAITGNSVNGIGNNGSSGGGPLNNGSSGGGPLNNGSSGGGSLNNGSSGGGIPNPLSGANSLCELLYKIINIIMEIGSIIAVLFLIYSGFLFIKAQGNEAEITKAKKVFFDTVIGIAILLGSSVIAKIILGTITSIVNIPGGAC